MVNRLPVGQDDQRLNDQLMVVDGELIIENDWNRFNDLLPQVG